MRQPRIPKYHSNTTASTDSSPATYPAAEGHAQMCCPTHLGGMNGLGWSASGAAA